MASMLKKQRDGFQSSPDDFYFFMHIPKTAGTSLRYVLEQVFPHKRLNAYLYSELYEQLKNGWIPKSNQSLMGHYYLGFIRRLFEILDIQRRLVVITFLRDPVERTLSHYAHYKHAGIGGKELTLDIDGFLESIYHQEVSNLQTRFISKQFTANSIDDLYEEWRAEGQLVSQGEDNSSIEQAVDILNNDIAFCGVTEIFEDSLIKMAQYFLWRVVSCYTLNVSDPIYRLRRDDLTPETLQKIEQLNQNDMKLWQCAIEKLVLR